MRRSLATNGHTTNSVCFRSTHSVRRSSSLPFSSSLHTPTYDPQQPALAANIFPPQSHEAGGIFSQAQQGRGGTRGPDQQPPATCAHTTPQNQNQAQKKPRSRGSKLSFFEQSGGPNYVPPTPPPPIVTTGHVGNKVSSSSVMPAQRHVPTAVPPQQQHQPHGVPTASSHPLAPSSFVLDILTKSPQLIAAPFSILYEHWLRLPIQHHQHFDLKEVQTLNSRCDREWLEKNPQYTVAHFGAATGSTKILDYILNNKQLNSLSRSAALLCAPDAHGNRPIHFAAMFGEVDTLERLIDVSPSTFHYPGAEQRNVAHFAAAHGHLPVLQFLHENQFCGIGPESRCPELLTAVDAQDMDPMRCAATFGHVAVLQHVHEVSMGEVLTFDRRQRSGVHFAAEQGHNEVLEFFAEHFGERYLSQAEKYGMTPAHFAAKKAKINALETLLSYGADIDIPDKRQLTPLFYCVRDGKRKAHVDTVKFLAKNGVNMFHRSQDGMTITQWYVREHGNHGSNMMKFLSSIVPL